MLVSDAGLRVTSLALASAAAISSALGGVAASWFQKSLAFSAGTGLSVFAFFDTIKTGTGSAERFALPPLFPRSLARSKSAALWFAALSAASAVPGGLDCGGAGGNTPRPTGRSPASNSGAAPGARSEALIEPPIRFPAFVSCEKRHPSPRVHLPNVKSRQGCFPMVLSLTRRCRWRCSVRARFWKIASSCEAHALTNFSTRPKCGLPSPQMYPPRLGSSCL
mmetsp:Transcript_12531/g.46823  ORF Transcript_12531/g.46823 Transcript_12531/m.46823 type:complete len:222 (+) Transcript_12531:1437-2102(+)